MTRSRWLCALLVVAAASPLLTGCGTSHTTSSGATTTVPHSRSASTGSSASTSPSYAASTAPTNTAPATTLGPTTRAVQYGQDACRAFESFADILAGQPEDGPDAIGEIAGMEVEASQALATNTDQQWTKLLADLKALQAVAASKQWPLTTAAAGLPQVKQVAADCQPIGVG